jgi:hypothetical protein
MTSIRYPKVRDWIDPLVTHFGGVVHRWLDILILASFT